MPFSSPAHCTPISHLLAHDRWRSAVTNYGSLGFSNEVVDAVWVLPRTKFPVRTGEIPRFDIDRLAVLRTAPDGSLALSCPSCCTKVNPSLATQRTTATRMQATVRSLGRITSFLP